MRFLMMVKSAENAGAPPKELMEAIAKMSAAETESGKMVMTGGLAPTVASTRVRVAKGTLDVIDGPFTETKEVVGGYAIMEFASKAEAIENTRRFMELHRKFWPAWEGETEVRQIFGPEDYTMDGGNFRLKPESLAKK
jgi:hypothetical protein